MGFLNNLTGKQKLIAVAVAGGGGLLFLMSRGGGGGGSKNPLLNEDGELPIKFSSDRVNPALANRVAGPRRVELSAPGLENIFGNWNRSRGGGSNGSGGGGSGKNNGGGSAGRRGNGGGSAGRRGNGLPWKDVNQQIWRERGRKLRRRNQQIRDLGGTVGTGLKTSSGGGMAYEDATRQMWRERGRKLRQRIRKVRVLKAQRAKIAAANRSKANRPGTGA